MGTRLFVGNLSFDTPEAELADLFGQAGEVADCTLVLDRVTSRSRGIAFVEMATEEAANKAIEQFNQYELNGRRLVVNEARPRESRGFGGGGGRGYGGGSRGLGGGGGGG